MAFIALRGVGGAVKQADPIIDSRKLAATAYSYSWIFPYEVKFTHYLSTDSNISDTDQVLGSTSVIVDSYGSINTSQDSTFYPMPTEIITMAGVYLLLIKPKEI